MDTYQTQGNNTMAPKSGGSYAAIIIVLLIIAVGGIYFWYSRSTSMPVRQNGSKTATTTSNEDLQKQLDTAGSVDVSADLNSMDEVYK